MNIGDARAIAQTVLYEGYMLWPYRVSALKNRRRLSFGALEVGGEGLVCETLIEAPATPQLECVVRFLQPVARRIRQGEHFVETLLVDGVEHSAWEEAAEREIVGDSKTPFSLPAGSSRESLSKDAEWWRQWNEIKGECRVSSEEIAAGIYKLRVEVDNKSAADTLHACHVVCRVRNGRFALLSESPHAAACHNLRTWPILLGDRERRDLLLCSPIILDDFPRLAPESAGDYFDATENDELLALNILALSDKERAEMAKADPRAWALLQRTLCLPNAEQARLHGTFRDRPHRFAPGDRVRLAPKRRSDIFDLALAGRSATVLEVMQDLDDRAFVTVSIDDDPGRDLDARHVGHRFFFQLDEVEWLGA